MATNIEVRNIIVGGGSGGGDFMADGSVPMTGDLNLNGNDIANVNSIAFDTTPTAITPTEGVLQWNPTDGTLNLGMNGGDITMQIGQESFIKVRNSTGATITNGTVVYFNGSLGNRPTIDKARSDVAGTSMVQGICTEDIPDNTDGFVTTAGYVRQIVTNYTGSGIWGTTWTEGQLLYVSKTTAGQLTNLQPPVPHHSDIVGTVGVVGGAGIGSILVNIARHTTLEDLSDVNGTPLTTSGQIPVWNQLTGYFDFSENTSDFEPANANIQSHISNTSNPHAVTKAQVGLSNVDNTSDANKPVSTATQTALNAKEATANKGVAGGYASLDGGGKVPTSQLPALALTDVYEVASQVAQLALTAEEGDIAIRSDENKSYVHNGGVAGTMADWSLLRTPTDAVLSVNGETGAVTLTTDDISDSAQTNKWATAGEKTKLGLISVTQAVDLDTIETNANNVPAIKTKTDFITVTQAVNLDTMESDISTKQPVDAGLTSISALTGAGYVKATATDTFSQVATIPNTDITGLGTLSTQNGTFSGTHSGTSSGTNTGDQTSIVGITGTKAQYNTSVTDGDFMYVGDAPTAHTHTLSQVTDVTMTVANLNSLDDGVNSTLHFHDADRARANHTGTQLASTISDFTEASQDAIGTILVDSAEIDFTYNDATPSITASIIAGSIDETKLDASTNASLDLADTASQPGHTHTASNITDFNSASRAQTEAELVAGANITITPSGTGATRQLTITSTGGGGGTLTVQDEGSTQSTTVTTLNFTGSGVTASGSGATATINIDGGGGGGGLTQSQVLARQYF